MLSHENLLANMRAMGAAMAASRATCSSSWLPLYHDMGLIGAWLGSLYFGPPLFILAAALPRATGGWLWAIHRHRGTLSAARISRTGCASGSANSLEGLDFSGAG